MPVLALTIVALAPMRLSAQGGPSVSGTPATAEAGSQPTLISDVAPAEGGQPPIGRHRRPRVRRAPYNPDGSLKYSFFAGGGFTSPTGQTSDSYATGFRFVGGAGRNFNRLVGLFLQFDWDGLSVRNDVLARLLPVYQQACGTVCTGSVPAEIFGSSHLWSFTLDPTYTFAGTRRTNAYMVAGVGFFHKFTRFSAPAATSSCNGCAQSPVTQQIDSYTSNAPGFNGGIGVTRQIARSDARIYGEVRYTFVNNQARPANTAAIGSGFNAFPAGTETTHMLPVTFGIRF